MKSRTYQAAAIPDPSNRDDESNFSHAAVRLLPAEVLLDAISQVLEVPERFRRAPGSLRAAQLPGVGGDVPFLKTFGKPERLLTCECERSESTTLAQAFQMINGPTVRRKLDAGDNRIARLLTAKADDRAILDELYLAALVREPNAGRTRRGDRVSAPRRRSEVGMGRHHLGATEQQGIPAEALRDLEGAKNSKRKRNQEILNTECTEYTEENNTI